MLSIGAPAFLLACVCLSLLGQAGAAIPPPLTITPTPPAQCNPTEFKWKSTGNTTVTIKSKDEETILQRYTGITGDSFTWATNVTAGTEVVIDIITAYSNHTAEGFTTDPITIQSGSDSCLDDHGTNGAVAGYTGRGVIAGAGFGITIGLLAVIAM